MKLAILTPSKGRLSGFIRLEESVVNTMSGENEIVFLIGADDNDPTDYESTGVIVKRYSGKSVAQIWNDLANSVEADYYILGADDYVFETKEWDKILVSKIQHPYNLLWFNDGIQHGNSCAFPIVSREWIDLMGFFVPEIFIHNYSDTFVYDVAKKAGVCVYIPEVQNRHLHFSIIPEVFDKTYEEGLKNDSWSKDAVTYGASEGIRIELAQRIKDKLV